MRRISPSRAFAATAIVLGCLQTGCTAIDLGTLAPPRPWVTGCESASASLTRGASVPAGDILLPLPRAADTQTRHRESIRTFADYVRSGKESLDKLPPEIRDHKVTQAFLESTLKSSASARTAAFIADARQRGGDGCARFMALQDEIESYPATTQLTHGELKDFTEKAVGLWLRPRLGSSSESSSGEDFKSYFEAYYGQKFVDRFGQPVHRPEISTSFPIGIEITDAQIATVIVVLVEYILDQIDPTPVFGDAKSYAAIDADKTKFYPNEKRPTFATIGRPFPYRCIQPKGARLNVEVLDRIVQVAKALGDRAAAIGGLSFNSFGGVGASLGFFGKVSIGDNQTLSVLVKTAVARLAMRMSYASSVALVVSQENRAGACEAGSEAIFVFP